jgi:hypothetical protein
LVVVGLLSRVADLPVTATDLSLLVVWSRDPSKYLLGVLRPLFLLLLYVVKGTVTSFSLLSLSVGAFQPLAPPLAGVFVA